MIEKVTILSGVQLRGQYRRGTDGPNQKLCSADALWLSYTHTPFNDISWQRGSKTNKQDKAHKSVIYEKISSA